MKNKAFYSRPEIEETAFGLCSDILGASYGIPGAAGYYDSETDQLDIINF